MTTCVVVRKNGQAAIAADSLVTFGDTRLAQDSIAEPPGIFLGVNRHPHFLPGRGVLQQQVAALP